MIPETFATSSMTLRNHHDFPQPGRLEHHLLHFRIVGACFRVLHQSLQHLLDVNTSFSEHPQFSVPFALLAPASRLGFPPLDRGIDHVVLLLLSARFELVLTWRYVASCTSTNLSSCRTSGMSAGFSTVSTCLCTFTEMSTLCR